TGSGKIDSAIGKSYEDETMTPLAIAQAVVQRGQKRSCAPVIEPVRGRGLVIVRADDHALFAVAAQLTYDVGSRRPLYRLFAQKLPVAALRGEQGLNAGGALLVGLRHLLQPIQELGLIGWVELHFLGRTHSV